MSEPFAYDTVEYPTTGLPLMHPSHLFAVARMFGCTPAPVERCRYLEYGCGDGTHLVACAVGLPEATFVGVDLSATAIARGRQLIADLGVANVQLVTADVTAWQPPGEEYDYACAHGLYSWVPLGVRDALLAGLHAALAPHGVGHVSYNTYPGGHLRRMVWEMMRHHTAHVSDPPAKIREATDLLKFLLAGLPAEGRSPPVAAFAHELTHLLTERNPVVLYHDDLSAVNDPVYFHQFVAHAGRHGLRFVAEAEHTLMDTGTHPPAAAEVLNGLAATDVTAREQYADFLRLRRFRQTILAKDGRPPLAAPDPTAAAELSASSQLTVEGDTSELGSAAELGFRRKEGVARTTDPLTKATMFTLAEVGPKRLPFEILLAKAVGRLGRGEPTADDRERLCGLLTESWMAGLIDLHGHAPSYAEGVSERPVACPFARNRARAGGVISTRLFKHQTFDDALKHVLLNLDGTRTADQLAVELAATYPRETRPDTATLRPLIGDALRAMARNGLLVG
jgi:SAM-dependent methyltransferase/methyltransferase-like protein